MLDAVIVLEVELGQTVAGEVKPTAATGVDNVKLGDAVVAGLDACEHVLLIVAADAGQRQAREAVAVEVQGGETAVV